MICGNYILPSVINAMFGGNKSQQSCPEKVLRIKERLMSSPSSLCFWHCCGTQFILKGLLGWQLKHRCAEKNSHKTFDCFIKRVKKRMPMDYYSGSIKVKWLHQADSIQ